MASWNMHVCSKSVHHGRCAVCDSSLFELLLRQKEWLIKEMQVACLVDTRTKCHSFAASWAVLKQFLKNDVAVSYTEKCAGVTITMSTNQ